MDFIWGSFFTGSITIIIGGLLILLPDYFGYQMLPKLKNKDTQVQANKYCGRILLVGGSISILLGLVLNLLFSVDHLSNVKLEGINAFLLILTSKIVATTALVLTEDYLNKTFDKEGNRRKT